MLPAEPPPPAARARPRAPRARNLHAYVNIYVLQIMSDF